MNVNRNGDEKARMETFERVHFLIHWISEGDENREGLYRAAGVLLWVEESLYNSGVTEKDRNVLTYVSHCLIHHLKLDANGAIKYSL